MALAACVANNLGTPTSYTDAFVRLAGASLLDRALSDRLVLAAGFRNAVAHAYEALDMKRVYEAASKGPADLRAFLAALKRQL